MWITLTPDKVKTRLTQPELSALLTAAKQDEQTADGLLADAIGAVAKQVRGRVGAHQPNVLGPDATIPDELEASALALVRRHLFTRLPNMASLFDELRQKECDDALAELRDAARGLIAIVPPEAPAPAGEQPGGASPSIAPRVRIYRREDGEGL